MRPFPRALPACPALPCPVLPCVLVDTNVLRRALPRASQHQEAAGLFGHLKEGEASKVDAPRPVDLSPECLSMLEKLMLAQAQVRLLL